MTQTTSREERSNLSEEWVIKGEEEREREERKHFVHPFQ